MIDLEDFFERFQQGHISDVWVLYRNSIWNDTVSPKRVGITIGLFACIIPGIFLYILLISSIRWYLIGYLGYRIIIVGIVFLIVVIPLISGFLGSVSLKNMRNTILLLTNEEVIYCRNYNQPLKRSAKIYPYEEIVSASFKVFMRKDYKNQKFVNGIEVILQYKGRKTPDIWMLDLQDQAFEAVLRDFTKFYEKYVMRKHAL
jgi:hypothetical protein